MEVGLRVGTRWGRRMASELGTRSWGRRLASESGPESWDQRVGTRELGPVGTERLASELGPESWDQRVGTNWDGEVGLRVGTKSWDQLGRLFAYSVGGSNYQKLRCQL